MWICLRKHPAKHPLFRRSATLAALSGRSDSCRLLLGHAVHGAKAPDKVPRIYGNNFAGREQLSENVQCDAIVGIVKSWQQDRRIADVKVGVAGGQTPSLK